jgi:hypothetical protein
MSNQRKTSRRELSLATAAKITGGGKQKYFKYVWIGMTMFWWLVGNFLLRRELISSYQGHEGFFVVFCWEIFSVLACVGLGFFSTKLVWFHLTKGILR